MTFRTISLAAFLVFVGIVEINGACMGDEVAFQGKCYYFGNIAERVNHDIAHGRCVNNHNGGELVQIETKAENDFLKQQMKTHTWGGSAYLIGGTDVASEGTWKWADGSAVTFTNWGPGQPDNFLSAEDCMTFYRPYGLASDYFWADVSCDVVAELYICERSSGA